MFSVCVSLHPQRGDCGDCVVPGHLAHQASKHGYSVVMCPQDRHLHTQQTIHLFWVSCKSFQPHVEGLFLKPVRFGRPRCLRHLHGPVSEPQRGLRCFWSHWRRRWRSGRCRSGDRSIGVDPSSLFPWESRQSTSTEVF